jgi:hypothetical protein
LIFTGRTLTIALVVGTLPGCALWKAKPWNFDSLRDERAVDIDSRLSEDRPIVQNPF